jgi:hypothetical protein
MRSKEQYATELANLKDFLYRFYYLGNPEYLVNIRTGNTVKEKKYEYYSNPENIQEEDPDIEKYIIRKGLTNDFGVKFDCRKIDNEYFEPFYGKVFKFKDGTIVYLCRDLMYYDLGYNELERKGYESEGYEDKISLLEEMVRLISSEELTEIIRNM